MGVRLYNQHYQVLMKRVRAGEGSYQHLVREIVDAYFKIERRALKKAKQIAPAEAPVEITAMVLAKHIAERMTQLEDLVAKELSR